MSCIQILPQLWPPCCPIFFFSHLQLLTPLQGFYCFYLFRYSNLCTIISFVFQIYGNSIFWIFYALFHMLVTLVLTVQIYYMGRWSIGKIIVSKFYHLLYYHGKIPFIFLQFHHIRSFSPYLLALLRSFL